MTIGPTQAFSIRAATRDDMTTIVGIYNWAINQTFATIDSEPLSREEAAEWWDAHAGKTITLSTYGAPGDSYDLYLRLLSRHYSKHIPGSPRFVVINQPGGGGLLAMNHAAVLAPQDGTFLTLASQALLIFEATGQRGLQTSIASGQRGWKRHPGGGSARLGGAPSSPSRGASSPIRGRLEMRCLV